MLLGDSGNQVPENASADNCKSILQIPPVHIADLQGKLEDKRVHCDNLWHVLGDMLVMAAGVLLPDMIMPSPAWCHMLPVPELPIVVHLRAPSSKLIYYIYTGKNKD